jgi:hypothetical protein
MYRHNGVQFIMPTSRLRQFGNWMPSSEAVIAAAASA